MRFSELISVIKPSVLAWIDSRLGQEAVINETPVTVTGSRDDPELALANLLSALETAGIIVDSTTDT